MSDAHHIDFVFFDIGGVLLEFAHLREAIPIKYGLDHKAYAAFMDKEAARRNEGTLTGKQLDTLFSERFGPVLPPRFWQNADLVEGFRPIKPAHDLVVELSKHYRLGLLSNISKEVFARIEHDFAQALLPPVTFEVIVTSFRERVVKPHPEIYHRAIERTQLPASAIMFVDDMKENIRAAQSVGMHGYVFDAENPEKSTATLRNMLLP